MKPSILRELLFSRIIRNAREDYIYDASGHVGAFIISLVVLIVAVGCFYFDTINVYVFMCATCLFALFNISAFIHLRNTTKLVAMEFILKEFEKYNENLIRNNGYIEQPLLKQPDEVKEISQNETD